MEIQYDHVPTESLRVIASTLQGPALWAMARDAAEFMDWRTLQILHEEGRFKIDRGDFMATPIRHDWRVTLSDSVPPVVDTLSAVILAHGINPVDYEFRGQELRTYAYVSNVSSEGQGLVRRICSDILDDLEAIYGNHDVVRHSTADDRMLQCRGVVCAIACALNDPALLQKALDGDDENRQGLFSPVGNCGLLMKPFQQATLFPASFAFLFGAKECLQLLGAREQSALLAMAEGPAQQLSKSSVTWSAPLLMSRLQDVNFIEPSVVACLLQAVHGKNGNRELPYQWCKEFADFAFETAPCYVPAMIEHGILEADPNLIVHGALERAIPELATMALEREGLITFPALQQLSPVPGGRGVLSEAHPVSRVLYTASKNPWDRDAVIQQLVQAMAKQGLATELCDALTIDKGLLAQELVRRDMPRALQALVDEGLDATVKVNGGRSLIDYAQDQGRQDLVTLLRAGQARRAARDALVDMGLEPAAEVAPARGKEVVGGTPAGFDEWVAGSLQTRIGDVPMVFWQRESQVGLDGDGEMLWFFDDRDVAEQIAADRGEDLCAVHLAMRNPARDSDIVRCANSLGIRLDNNERPVNDLAFHPELLQRLKDLGHDGVIGSDATGDGDEFRSYIVFSSQQVRLIAADEVAQAVESERTAIRKPSNGLRAGAL